MARSSIGQRRDHDNMSSHDDETDTVNNQQEGPRKRLRPSQTPLGSDEEDDTQTLQAESEEPLLPDSYRRSPKGKTRATQSTASRDVPSQYQPGSIVRVSLENFVTYTKAEFFPGPHLNMVIGPNGTGKSTLVCAICLGLGWSTKHLGRAKHISEFVKHGFKTAKIEIELAADPGQHDSNPVVKTRISRDSETAEFYLDGKKCPKKHVQELARSFSIQVDNLCQFLPQDRVAEFATLGPVKLLEATLSAAAPAYMSKQHEDLKRLGREQKDLTDEQQKMIDKLKSLDARQRAQQPDVDRLKQRSNLQTRLSMLEKAKPFPMYAVMKARFKEVNKLSRNADRQYAALEQQLQPNVEAVEAKADYLRAVSEVVKQRQRIADRHEQAVNNKLQRCHDSEQQIQRHMSSRNQQKQGLKEVRQQKAKLLHNIQKLEEAMQNAPPDTDVTAISADIRDKTRQIRDLEDKLRETNDKIDTVRGQGQQKSEMIRRLGERKDRMQSQFGQQASKLASASRDVARGWDWLQAHRDLFTGPVFGPAMLECSVKNKAHASAIETVLGQSDLLAFTVTNKADFDTMQKRFFGDVGVSTDIRIAPDVSTYAPRPPCSDDELRNLGLEGWLVDLLDGPAEVIAMLCDNKGLESIGHTSRTLSVAQSNAIENSPISNYVTAKEFSSISRRREYGDHAKSTRVQSLKPARFFTDAPVNRDEEDHIDRQIRELRMDCEQLKTELDSENRNAEAFTAQHDCLNRELHALKNEKDGKQRARQQFEALPTKLDGERDKLAIAEQKILQLQEDAKQFEADTNKLQLKHGQDVVEYANAVEAARNIQVRVLEAGICRIEAESDLVQLRQRDEAERQQLEVVRQEKQQLATEKAELRRKAEDLQVQCQAVKESCSEEEEAVIDSVREYTIEQMEAEIDSTKAQLELHTGGNVNILREFEQRANKIQQKHRELETSREAISIVKEKVKEIRDQWEPELDTIVGKISSAFSDNFAAISCAGEVSVYKDDEDYEKWAIQIKVKFRESEALSILDSHRQSGGERSVSTIFYLMAMQSLARAPFRVVDEINQGMDPRNERMVHSRLVAIACEARREDGGGGSQYFLITPKLLTGLEYHANMRIHCIASGEWMPDNLSSLNFDSMARKALAIRAV